MFEARITSLDADQISYLRLVSQGLTSKQIAQRLGGSHHTINAQIAMAVRLIGARDRVHAASLLANAEANGSYERSYDAPNIAELTSAHANKMTEETPVRSDGFALPIATKGRPRNTLNFWERTMWILVLAAFIALIAGGLFTGIIAQLDALGRRT